MQDAYNRIFKHKSRILVIMAHPDDTEIICGGTVARLIKDGKKVRSVVLTNGDKGMHGNVKYLLQDFAAIRLSSQIAGGMELGLLKPEIINLGIPDGQVELTYETIGRLVYHLREFRPDIVITHNPFELVNSYSKKVRWINHRDHRHTAVLALDATYPYCRDVGFFPEQINAGLLSHEVTEFLFADSYLDKNAIGIEVSNFLQQKRRGLEHHMQGEVLSQGEVDGFIEELRKRNGNFEVFRYENIKN